MEYDFLKIEEHDTLAECQITALSEVNNHLIETESCLQQILKIKTIKIENTIRTKLLSFLDYLNKIIITPNSSRTFSYQYFYYYREVLIQMNDISLHFEYPSLATEIIPSLEILFNKILKIFKQTKNKKKKKSFQARQPQNEQSKDDNLSDTFSKILLLKDNPFEFAKAQGKFHELSNIIKAKFQEINKDPAMILIDYSIILQSIDSTIDDINFSHQTKHIFYETITLLSKLKGLEEVKCDMKNENDNPDDNSNNNENQTTEFPFKKRLPDKTTDSSCTETLPPSNEINIDSNQSSLPVLRSPQHTPERAKSLHTNLVNIIEEKDKKIQQLQQNISNEVEKKEEAQDESTKLRHHYRKKIKKLKERIAELDQNDEQISFLKTELDDLKAKNTKLEEENANLISQTQKLNTTIQELTDLNDAYAQEIEEKEKNKNEELNIIQNQSNLEEIEKLNETINLQEIEIQELDSMNKKYKETISSLVKDNDKIRQENSDLKSNQAQFEKKEQILGKQISLLSTQNSRSINEIQKILKNQEKRMNKFSDMVNSQIITSPDEIIREKISELSKIKNIMAERNINSVEDFEVILKEYDDFKKQEH